MVKPKYELIIDDGNTPRDKSVLSDERELELGLFLTIRETSNKISVANIHFSISWIGKERLMRITSSSQNKMRVLDFFRVFRQSPFRLLLLSTFSIAKKTGATKFFSGSGMGDFGQAHRKQEAEGLFKHVKFVGPSTDTFHELGVFPSLSVSELSSILKREKPVPKRLLSPSSPLRKVRAASYVKLKLNRLGKTKYEASKKLRVVGK
ncbi:MAG: hypothetical protein WCW13_01170 [archaeon]|jgi:hypothetical protein